MNLREFMSGLQQTELGVVERAVSPDLEMARVIHALTIVAGDSQLLPYLNTYFQVTDEAVPEGRMLEALIALIASGISANKT